MSDYTSSSTWAFRLFGLNLLLFWVFLQSYLLGSESERWNGLDLPFFTFFISGVFVFFFVMVWLNVGALLYQRLHKNVRALKRIVWLSAAPFMAAVIIGWFVISLLGWGALSSDIQKLSLIFTIHVALYPLFMILAHTHAEIAKSLER